MSLAQCGDSDTHLAEAECDKPQPCPGRGSDRWTVRPCGGLMQSRHLLQKLTRDGAGL